jgi:hypothetical protein
MAMDPVDDYGDDPEMSRLLRERLPRRPASPRLRAAVARALEPPPRRWGWGAWLPPGLAAVATALILVMWMAPALPKGTPSDPLQRIARAAVNEYARTVSWSEPQPDVVTAGLARVSDESGVLLSSVFAGDDELQLMSAHPTYLDSHRGLALTYVDRQGAPVAYIVIPGGAVTLPERGRVQIDRWRPVFRTDNGFTVIMWKQRGLLCVMVAGLVAESEQARLRQYFVKVRSATEPYTTY